MPTDFEQKVIASCFDQFQINKLHFVVVHVSPLAISLELVPTSLTFIAKHDTVKSCGSAFYKPNGDLLLGCEGAVMILKQGTDKAVEASESEGNDNTYVIEHMNDLMVLMGNNLNLYGL